MAKKRINTDGGGDLGQNPFADLSNLELPRQAAPAQPQPASPAAKKQKAQRSYRFEVRRERAGRGGKTVTLVRPLAPVPQHFLQELLKELKSGIGAGGRLDSGLVEMQGDHVAKLVDMLKQRGHSAHPGN